MIEFHVTKRFALVSLATPHLNINPKQRGLEISFTFCARFLGGFHGRMALSRLGAGGLCRCAGECAAWFGAGDELAAQGRKLTQNLRSTMDGSTGFIGCC